MSEVIVNKVAESGIITLNLEDYIPKGEIVSFDLKDYLFMGMVLKEKDFREALKNLDWSQFSGKNVNITCSADAIIPLWAYMLVTSYLQPVASHVFAGTREEMYKYLFLTNLSAIDPASFAGQRVVIKGCGDITLDNYTYTEITRLLMPVVKSLMYGEPCSTVPIYKKK